MLNEEMGTLQNVEFLKRGRWVYIKSESLDNWTRIGQVAL